MPKISDVFDEIGRTDKLSELPASFVENITTLLVVQKLQKVIDLTAKTRLDAWLKRTTTAVKVNEPHKVVNLTDHLQ